MTEREPLLRTAAEAAEDDYWDRLYGHWEPFDPPAAREFFAGFDRPWWVVGGWSIEAFTGVRREHEDLDVSMLACDVAALREHVGERWQLWNICDGALRPLTDHWPDVQAPDSQIWVRRDAHSPWVMDMPLTPDRDGAWTNKRWADDVRPVEDATWLAEDGIHYARPEVTLLYKAVAQRAKDDRDLEVCWPLLAPGQQEWLRDAVRLLYPDHAWLERLSG